MNTIIGIQGIAGSFHHQVAQEYFNHEFVLDECLSFEELIDNLMSGKSVLLFPSADFVFITSFVVISVLCSLQEMANIKQDANRMYNLFIDIMF